jgi:hypothetical protein
MRQVVLIPLDGNSELEMYKSISSGGTKLSNLEPLLFSRLHELLLETHGDKSIIFWGVPSGVKSSAANKWNKINANDVALFSHEDKFIGAAPIKIKFQSENIARELWPSLQTLDPRQYLFTLQNLIQIDESSNAALSNIRRKAKFSVTDFQVLGSQVSLDILGAIVDLIEPKSETKSSQGFGLNAKEKKVIENYSVSKAVEHLFKLGYEEIEDVGDRESFDLIAKSSSKVLSVEVKGSTGLANNVILTRNEVAFQKRAYPNNALIIVSNIVLDRDGSLKASGGDVRFISPWKVQEDSLTPISYDYKV